MNEDDLDGSNENRSILRTWSWLCRDAGNAIRALVHTCCKCMKDGSSDTCSEDDVLCNDEDIGDYAPPFDKDRESNTVEEEPSGIVPSRFFPSEKAAEEYQALIAAGTAGKDSSNRENEMSPTKI